MRFNETVILIHGLNRTSHSFSKIERSLICEGYKVINLAYPSRNHSIETLVSKYIEPKLSLCIEQEYTKIHFVTHSMGGILLRYYLKHHTIKNLGNCVMLAPPNQGSEIVDKLRDIPIFQYLVGPAGQQLGTEPTSLPNLLGAVNYPVGVITGNKSINPILSCIIDGKNDGKVSIKRAKVLGMADFIDLPYSHTTIMLRSPVIKQIQYFLKNCQFQTIH